MNYLGGVVAVSIMWGIADVVRKLSAGQGDPKLLTIFFNLGAVIIPLIWLISGTSRKVNTDMSAIAINVIGGGLAGIGGVLLYSLLAKNSASVTFGLVRTIMLITVFVLSTFFLSDKVSAKMGVGFVLSLAGVILLASK